MITETQWLVERQKLVDVQDGIQEVIDDIDGYFFVPVSGTAWSRTGVANNPIFSNGDLTVAGTGLHAIRANVSLSLAKLQFSYTCNAEPVPGVMGAGIIADTQSIASPPNSLASVPSGMWMYRTDGWCAHNGSSFQLASYTVGDKITFQLDENGNLWIRKNGTLLQGDPDTASNPVFSGITGTVSPLLLIQGNTGSVGTGDFTETPYSGWSLWA